MRPLLLATGLLCLSPSLSSQNLLKNGDFEATSVSPWTVSGYALNPKLEKYNTNGTALTQAFANTPGGKTVTGPFPPLVLSQSGLIMVPTVHELSFDLALAASAPSITPALPTVAVLLDSRVLAKVSFTGKAANPRRQRVCLRFVPQGVGKRTLHIQFAFNTLARPTGPRYYIDNVDLRRAQDPIICIRNERKIGGTLDLQILGKPRGVFALFIASKNITPITVPGFAGTWELDLLTLGLFLTGGLDAAGSFAVKLPIPNDPRLAGLPIWWQGIEIDSSPPGASIGPAHDIRLYP